MRVSNWSLSEVGVTLVARDDGLDVG